MSFSYDIKDRSGKLIVPVLLPERMRPWTIAEQKGEAVVKARKAGIGLANADLRNTRLKGALLSEACFKGADLSNAWFVNATLETVDFQSALITYGSFDNSYLSYADFTGANLECTSFRGAHLYGASFRGANLLGVNLQCANLGGVDFRGATIGLFTLDCLVCRLWRKADPYEFFIFKTESGELLVRAGCRTMTLPLYRRHAEYYLSPRKTTETMAILDHAEKMEKIISEVSK